MRRAGVRDDDPSVQWSMDSESQTLSPDVDAAHIQTQNNVDILFCLFSFLLLFSLLSVFEAYHSQLNIHSFNTYQAPT